MLPSSEYYGTLTHQQGQFEHQEKQRADEAEKSGQILSGYKDFDLSTSKKGGGRLTKTMQQAIYIDAPKAAPAPATPVPVPAPNSQSKPQPTGPVEHSPEIQQAKERVAKYQDDVLSGKTSQDIYGGADDFYADSSLKGNYTFDASNNVNSTEGEKFTPNLNVDLPNNVDTTDNNNFANGTFDPVNKSDEAALNFLSDKKNLVLNNFR